MFVRSIAAMPPLGAEFRSFSARGRAASFAKPATSCTMGHVHVDAGSDESRSKDCSTKVAAQIRLLAQQGRRVSARPRLQGLECEVEHVTRKMGRP
jgi:hypothetical protein